MVEKALKSACRRIEVLASRPPKASRVKPIAAGLRANRGHPYDSNPIWRYALLVETGAAKPK